jgi:hypothetical protein
MYAVDAVQWKFKCEPGPGASIAGYCTTQGFDALAHASQAIAFHLDSASAIVLNLHDAIAIAGHDLQDAGAGLCVPYDVSDSLTHNKRGNTFLRRAHRNFSRFFVHGNPGAFEHGSGSD